MRAMLFFTGPCMRDETLALRLGLSPAAAVTQ